MMGVIGPFVTNNSPILALVEAFYPTGIAITAAQGISLLDATMLDRILKGWRPNQFIEGRLSQFVSGDQ